MSDAEAQGDIATNDGTSFIVAVPYLENGTPQAGKYAQVLRMGAWDSTIEAGLVDSSGNTIWSVAGGNTAYTGDDPLQDPGILAYSADQYTIYSPTIRIVGQVTASSWASENYNVTVSGGEVVAYSYSAWSGATMSWQHGSNYSITSGNEVGFILGNAMTVWAGNDASTGFGGLLWSNVGVTQNLFHGQVVNINGPDLSVQGMGSTSLTRYATTVATGSIALTVNMTAGAAFKGQILVDRLGFLTRMATIVAVGTAGAVDAVDLANTDVMNAAGGEHRIATAAKTVGDLMEAVSAAIVGIQIMTVLTGITMSALADTIAKLPVAGALTLGGTESELRQGPTSSVKLTPMAATISSVTGSVKMTEELNIEAGLETSVLVSPDGIVLKCGSSSLIVTRMGIIAQGMTTGFGG